MAMSTNAIARIPHRGFMSPQTSGTSFQAWFGLAGLVSNCRLLENGKDSTQLGLDVLQDQE